MTRTAVSQHLTVLRHAGLLTERRDGTRRLYRARPEGLAGLQEFLDDMWGQSLDLARRLVEAERGISDDAAPRRRLTLERTIMATMSGSGEHGHGAAPQAGLSSTSAGAFPGPPGRVREFPPRARSTSRLTRSGT